MPDYKKMYYTLFNAVTDALEHLYQREWAPPPPGWSGPSRRPKNSSSRRERARGTKHSRKGRRPGRGRRPFFAFYRPATLWHSSTARSTALRMFW